MPEYASWANMKARCGNPKDRMYKYYGARGISVSDEMKSFEGFMEIMGVAPEGMSLDRINVNGNYERGNVRWATKRQQMLNRTDNRIISCFGKTQTLTEWAEEIGVPMPTLWRRIEKGTWSLERSLSEKVLNANETAKSGAVARWRAE